MVPTLQTWKSTGQYHQVGAYKIFVIDQGQHAETIVILHGYPSGSYDYYAVLPILTQKYRVIIHDHLGLGLSDKPENYSYSLIEQADVALALWKKLKLDNVHLLAHDYGTSVATEIIARANQGYEPTRLKSITLGNGSMLIEMSQLLITQKLLKHDFWGPILASLSRKPIFTNSFRKLWADKSKINYKELNVLWEMLNYNNGRKVLPRVTKYIEERKKFWHRWIGGLEQTNKHINLIWADKDPVAIVAMAYELEKKIPSNSLNILQGIGHYPMLEAPEIYATAVMEAIEKNLPNAVL
jgi:pimeloyl-ACP methyl ester carboxylesterase